MGWAYLPGGYSLLVCGIPVDGEEPVHLGGGDVSVDGEQRGDADKVDEVTVHSLDISTQIFQETIWLI